MIIHLKLMIMNNIYILSTKHFRGERVNEFQNIMVLYNIIVII